MELRSSFATIRGVRVHWAECGPASNKVPLVLLHGISDSHLTWKPVAAALAADRRVLMPDAPGCGLSDRPDASYALRWHAGVLTDWLKTLGLTMVDVVGHSFGGGLAQMLLVQRSLRVRRLGLIASGGLGRRVGILLRIAALPGLVEYFGQPFMAAGTRLALRGVGPFIAAEDVEALSAMNATSGTARALARTMQDVLSLRGQSRHFFHHVHEMNELPPVTLFWGDRDLVTPIEDALAFLRKVRHVTLHRFNGCGHYVHHEQPELLVQKLLTFLDAPFALPLRVRSGGNAFDWHGSCRGVAPPTGRDPGGKPCSSYNALNDTR
jgi:pimeloyl-ACP methyl ester carboxylesterase